MEGLRYLQTELSACVDHKVYIFIEEPCITCMNCQNKDEEKEFRLLASQLFKEEGMSDHMVRCQKIG